MQKYLILKGNAGLGNRIYTLCHAIEYASRNSRKLIIDWADGLYFERGQNFFDDYFYLEDVDYNCADQNFYSNLESQDLGIYPSSYSHNLHLPIYELYVQVSNHLMMRIGHRLRWRSKLMGYWLEMRHYKQKQNLSAFSYLLGSLKKNSLHLGAHLPDSIPTKVVVFADYTPAFNQIIFKKHFRLKESYLAKANLTGQDLDISGCVGIHVRATDLMPTKPVEFITQYIKKNHPGKPIFLATDSSAIVDHFKSVFPDVRIQKKETSDSTTGIHQISNRKKDYTQARVLFESSLTDMYLLSKCKILYYQGNSSFSKISSAMSNEQTIDWLKLS